MLAKDGLTVRQAALGARRRRSSGMRGLRRRGGSRGMEGGGIWIGISGLRGG